MAKVFPEIGEKRETRKEKGLDTKVLFYRAYKRVFSKEKQNKNFSFWKNISKGVLKEMNQKE